VVFPPSFSGSSPSDRFLEGSAAERVDLAPQARVFAPEVRADDDCGEQVRDGEGPPAERPEDPAREERDHADEERLEGREEEDEPEEEGRLVFGLDDERGRDQSDPDEGGEVDEGVAADGRDAELDLGDPARLEEERGPERSGREERAVREDVEDEEPDRDDGCAEESGDAPLAQGPVFRERGPPPERPVRSLRVEVPDQDEAG